MTAGASMTEAPTTVTVVTGHIRAHLDPEVDPVLVLGRTNDHLNMIVIVTHTAGADHAASAEPGQREIRTNRQDVIGQEQDHDLSQEIAIDQNAAIRLIEMGLLQEIRKLIRTNRNQRQ